MKGEGADFFTGEETVGLELLLDEPGLAPRAGVLVDADVVMGEITSYNCLRNFDGFKPFAFVDQTLQMRGAQRHVHQLVGGDRLFDKGLERLDVLPALVRVHKSS